MRLSGLVCAVALLEAVAFGQTPLKGPAPTTAKQSPSQIQSPSYDDLVTKALSLLAEKKAKEAAALSEQAIAQNQTRWEAYAAAASAYSAQQLYDDTISMLQMALGRAPEGKKQAIRDALASARRQVAAESSKTIVAAPTAPPGVSTQPEIMFWKSIETSNRAEDYRGYLATYPNGAYAGLAKSRLEEIIWKPIATGGDQDDLRTYLQTYPTGAHAVEASNRLQKLRWTAIEKSSNPADFRRFVQEFPNSSYAALASDRLDELDWGAVSSSSDAADYKAFIDAHPGGQHLPAAQKQYANLLEQEKKKKEQAEEAKVKENEKMRSGWEFKWVHRHLRPSWAYGIPFPVFDDGVMTVSPQGLKWDEKPGSSHNFTATCSELKYVENDNVDIYVRGSKITFVGDSPGKSQFLKGFTHFCKDLAPTDNSKAMVKK